MDAQFKVGDACLSQHGPLLYEAKVLKVEYRTPLEYGEQTGWYYFIHYKSWKKKHDNWVCADMVLPINDETMELQQKLQQEQSVNKRNYVQKQQQKPESKLTVETDEQFSKKAEVRIPIPDILKVQLVDDWEFITKQQRLVGLPRDITVVDILDKFAETQRRNPVVKEILTSLQMYFDRALGTLLLYRQERPQYARVYSSDFVPSRNYGAEHLLRLFCQLPMLVAHTQMSEQNVLLLKDVCHELLAFMARHQQEIFMQEYDNALPEKLV